MIYSVFRGREITRGDPIHFFLEVEHRKSQSSALDFTAIVFLKLVVMRKRAAPSLS